MDSIHSQLYGKVNHEQRNKKSKKEIPSPPSSFSMKIIPAFIYKKPKLFIILSVILLSFFIFWGVTFLFLLFLFLLCYRF